MAELPAGFSLVDDEPQRQSAPVGLPAGFQLVDDEPEQQSQNGGWATRGQRETAEPVGAMEAAGRGVSQGVTFGFADELRGLTEAGGTGPNEPASLGGVLKGAYGMLTGDPEAQRNYERATIARREELAQARQQQPVAAYGGEIAGGVAVPVGAMGQAATRGQAVVQGAKAGAVGGALYGAGQGEDLQGRATGAATGAAVGGVLGGALGGAIGPRAAQAPGMSSGDEVVAASERLGVSVPRAVATDSMAVQRAAAGARNVPFAGDPLVKAAEGTIQGLGQKADEVATAMGGADRLGAGSTASGGIRDWITGKSAAVVSKAYDDVERAVNPNVRSPLPTTQQVVADIAARRQNALLQGESKAINEVLPAVQSPNGLNFQGIKDLRSTIGEQLKRGILPEGMDAGELKRIYGALSDDLKNAAEAAGGPRGKQLFERANALNAAVAKRREELAKIVGTKGDASPEQVFDRLVSFASEKGGANANLLAKARNALGEDWEEVVSGVVARLGRDAEDNFTPDRFVTAWGKLSSSGKSTLFGSGGHRSALEDIATISSRFKELNKFANPSGTAQNATFAATGAGLIASPVTTIASIVGGNVLSRILAQPATASSMARWSRVYQAAVTKPSAATAATLQVATRNLAATIGDKLGVSVAPEQILRAIAGPRMSPASDGQTDQEKQGYRQ
jgi:hypothetical protein